VPEKSFAYLRVSGKGQLEGDGFTRQLEGIKSYAKAHNIRVVKVFREEGVSGTKELEHRPALMALMEALHANGTKLVLVEQLSRLARDLMIQESILHDLKAHGFRLVSVLEPDLCGDDATRKCMRQIMGAFHEYEKTMIVSKLRGARQRKKLRTGGCEGAKPFGHYEGEAAVLEKMKQLRADGLGYDKIATRLNEEGVKTRRGAMWYPYTVSKILARQESK
jgi:DNA invertase Pin-like site-specific DNA recombinase